jgi:hypothetical protein
VFKQARVWSSPTGLITLTERVERVRMFSELLILQYLARYKISDSKCWRKIHLPQSSMMIMTEGKQTLYLLIVTVTVTR